MWTRLKIAWRAETRAHGQKKTRNHSGYILHVLKQQCIILLSSNRVLHLSYICIRVNCSVVCYSVPLSDWFHANRFPNTTNWLCCVVYWTLSSRLHSFVHQHFDRLLICRQPRRIYLLVHLWWEPPVKRLRTKVWEAMAVVASIVPAAA